MIQHSQCIDGQVVFTCKSQDLHVYHTHMHIVLSLQKAYHNKTMSLINVVGPVAQRGDIISTLANLSRMFRMVGDVARAICAIPIVFNADVAYARDNLPT